MAGTGRKTGKIEGRAATGDDDFEIEERHLDRAGTELDSVSAGLMAGAEGSWRASVMKAGLARRRYSPFVRFLIRQLLRPRLLKGISQPDALLFLGTVAQSVGKEALGEELLLRAADADPQRAAAHGRLAEALLVQGHQAEAEAAFRKRLAVDPKEVAAQLGLAIALQGQGRLAEAERTLRYALKEQPDEPNLSSLLGSLLLASGRREEALKLCRRLVELRPTDASALSNLGNVLTVLGRREEAVAACRRALELDPDLPEALCNLGSHLFDLGRIAEAKDHLERALAARPDMVEALCNLGNVHHSLKNFTEAEALFRKALALASTRPELLTNLGNALFGQTRFAEALAYHQRAVELAPAVPIHLNNLGNSLQKLDRLDEALDAYRKAIALDAKIPNFHENTASVLTRMGLYREALQAIRRAIRLGAHPTARIKEAVILPIIVGSSDEIETARTHLRQGLDRLVQEGVALDDPLKRVNATTFHLAYHAKPDRELQELAARVYRQSCPDLTWTAAHCRGERRKTPRDRRIRIGFLSDFFRETHTVGRLYRGLIETLPRDRFEVILLPIGREPNEAKAKFEAVAERVVRLPEAISDIRQIVGDLELDILYYADIGMTPFTYYLAFSRLAPLQCVGWGHPDTTGIPTLDLFVSAEPLEPPGAEAHYSERLLKLPRIPLFYTPPKPPEGGLRDRDYLKLPKDKRLYICTQTLFKLHPEFDEALAGILEGDEQGMLVFIGSRTRSWVELLKARLAKRLGVNINRVLFLPPLGHADFLSLNGVADALLDTFHFSGGHTSLEAFAFDAPVVTWPGEFMRGRVTLGYYRQMGMEDLVARDPAHYVELALRLAKDRDWRQAMREKIRERKAAVFEDAASIEFLARALEDELRKNGFKT
ncbi:MAG: tetratricopeptide repeat protein [Rhodospirillales bacterium]|nr:tetratricopeptide repeat protein [Rhodospirillales bacterium]